MAKFKVTLRRTKVTVEEQVVEIEAEDSAEAEEIAADEADDDAWKEEEDGYRDDEDGEVSVEDVEELDEKDPACPGCGKRAGEGRGEGCEDPEGCGYFKAMEAAARAGWRAEGADAFRRDGTEIVVRLCDGRWRLFEDGTQQTYVGGQGSRKIASWSSAEEAQRAVDAELAEEGR